MHPVHRMYLYIICLILVYSFALAILLGVLYCISPLSSCGYSPINFSKKELLYNFIPFSMLAKSLYYILLSPHTALKKFHKANEKNKQTSNECNSKNKSFYKLITASMQRCAKIPFEVTYHIESHLVSTKKSRMFHLEKNPEMHVVLCGILVPTLESLDNCHQIYQWWRIDQRQFCELCFK